MSADDLEDMSELSAAESSAPESRVAVSSAPESRVAVSSGAVATATLPPMAAATYPPMAAPAPARPKYPRPVLLRAIRWPASYVWLALALAYLIPVGITVAQVLSTGGMNALSDQATLMQVLLVDQATALWNAIPPVAILIGITIVLLLAANVVAALDRRRERRALLERRALAISQARVGQAEQALAAERARAMFAERQRVETESRLAALDRARQDAEARAYAASEQARRATAAASAPLNYANAGMVGAGGMAAVGAARGPAYPGYAPPASAPAAVPLTPRWTASKPIKLKRLGVRVDGYATTADDIGDRAPALLQAFAEELPSHLMPNVEPKAALLGITGLDAVALGVDNPLSPGSRALPLLGRAFAILPFSLPTLFGFQMGGKQRPYQLAAITPGATVAININRTGKDLFVCWDLFVRRVWNEVTFAILILLSAIYAIGIALYSASIHLRLPNEVESCSSFLGRFTCTTQTKTSLLIGDAIGILPNFIGALIVIAALFMLAGIFFHGKRLWYFVKRIDLFEANDIEALELVVHKTLYRAADKVGVDTKLFRAKTEFRAGEQNRLF